MITHACRKDTFVRVFETKRIDILENLTVHVRIQIEIRLTRTVHRERICRHPPSQLRRQEPLPEIRQPNFNVLFLARESVVLSESVPSLGSVIAFLRTKGQVSRL